MSKKYRIVKLPTDGEVDLYGAQIGDVVKITSSDHWSSAVWCIGSDVFKEKGWEGYALYCVAHNMELFLKYVEEVV